MNKRKLLSLINLTAALVILGVAVLAVGQANNTNNSQHLESGSTGGTDSKSNARQQPSPSPAPRREENKKPPDPSKYTYEFTQPQFSPSHILIEHDASGRGKITFQRQGESSP